MAEPLSSTRKASPVPSFDSIWDLLNQKGWGVGPSTVCVTSLAGPGDDSAHSRQRGPGVECATRDRLRVGERTQQSNHRGVFCFYAENRNPRGPDSQASPARGAGSIPRWGTKLSHAIQDDQNICFLICPKSNHFSPLSKPSYLVSPFPPLTLKSFVSKIARDFFLKLESDYLIPCLISSKVKHEVFTLPKCFTWSGM